MSLPLHVSMLIGIILLQQMCRWPLDWYFIGVAFDILIRHTLIANSLILWLLPFFHSHFWNDLWVLGQQLCWRCIRWPSSDTFIELCLRAAYCSKSSETVIHCVCSRAFICNTTFVCRFHPSCLYDPWMQKVLVIGIKFRKDQSHTHCS